MNRIALTMLAVTALSGWAIRDFCNDEHATGIQWRG